MDTYAGDPWAGLTARVATAWDESSRLIRCACRTAATWYDFQELRYTRNQLWARLTAERRRCHLPPTVLEMREPPAYLFVTNAAGVRRLVRRPLLAGGAGLDDRPENMLICTLREHNGAACLAIDGELDLASVASFLGYLLRAGDSGRDVVVDLQKLLYIDSSGINALLRVRERYARTGQRIVLADVPARIRRIFDVIAVAEVIPMFPTVDAALAGFRDGTKPA
jgi:anti-sigma B factor antagonist